MSAVLPAGPMAVWVSANMAYSEVLKQTAPLEKELAALNSSLADSQARLGTCQQELQQLDEQVRGCVCACLV